MNPFLFIPVYLLLDSLFSLTWSSLFTNPPAPHIKSGIWIRPAIPQAGSWATMLDEVQRGLKSAAQDIPDYSISRIIRSMPIPMDEAIIFQHVNRNLTLARDASLNPARLNREVTKHFQTIKDEPAKGFETWWHWINFMSGRRQLTKYGIGLLGTLGDAYMSRLYVIDQIWSVRRGSLDNLTHQVCRASGELEKHARTAEALEWYTRIELLQAHMTTDVVCKQTQVVREELKALFDRVGIEMQGIKALMRQVEGVLQDLKKKYPLSEKQMDAYESEYFGIGESAMKLIETGWLEL